MSIRAEALGADASAYPIGLRDVTVLGEECSLARDPRAWCWLGNDADMGIGSRSNLDVVRPRR